MSGPLADPSNSDSQSSSLKHNPINANTPSDYGFESQSSTVQFTVLAFGVFLFFGLHNYLQEAIMSVPGWHFGVMLGYWEVFGVTVCSFFERRYIAQETKRVAPISAYPLLTLCLLSSSSLSNMALNYINFPTKVVFRSCKLIPTMIVASVVHKKIFSSMEYFCAFCVCMGLVCFAGAEWNLAPSFHPIGLAFVSLSVFADAVLPNAQERLFRLGSSRLEVTFFTNIFTLIVMTVTTFLSGDLIGMIQFARGNTLLCTYVVVYTFVAYIAISVHMNVVRRFGGVAAVLLATGRKGMTLVLSFVLFPKAFSWLYVVGALLVLGGLLLSSLHKIHQKNAKNKLMRKNSDSAAVHMMSETKGLVGNGDVIDQNGPYDIEHRGVGIDLVGNGTSGPDAVSALEMRDRHETSSPSPLISQFSRSTKENGLFGLSPRHDHQQ